MISRGCAISAACTPQDVLLGLIEERFDSYDNTLDSITRYGFDLASNRVSLSKDVGNTDPQTFTADETTTYSYDANDRLLDEVVDKPATADDRNTVYTYDETQQSGKTVRTGLTIGSGTVLETHAYEYNRQGRLSRTEVTKGGVTTVSTYTYDDDGIRVKQTEQVDGGAITTTEYLIDDQNHTGYAQILEEYVNGSLARTYTLGHDILTQAEAGGAVYHLLYDGHGSTRALLDSLAAVVNNDQRFAYDAYGSLLLAGVTGYTGTVDGALTSLLYSGEQTDRTGLQYLRARYYDLATGRFEHLDPFFGNISDPESLHKYLYAHGDPVNGTDPSGESLAISISLGSSLSHSLNVGRAVAAFGTLEFGLSFAASVGAAHVLVHSLPFVIDAAGQGVEGAHEALAKTIARTREIADAISNAVNQAAAATATSIQQLRRLPVFPIIESLGPKVYAFDTSALAARPDWFLLTYNGIRSPLTPTNRSWVHSNWRHLRNGAPVGYELDEFPFAATQEGGPSGPALGRMVPATENATQGGLFGAFTRWSLQGAARPFLVVPIPV